MTILSHVGLAKLPPGCSAPPDPGSQRYICSVHLSPIRRQIKVARGLLICYLSKLVSSYDPAGYRVRNLLDFPSPTPPVSTLLLLVHRSTSPGEASPFSNLPFFIKSLGIHPQALAPEPLGLSSLYTCYSLLYSVQPSYLFQLRQLTTTHHLPILYIPRSLTTDPKIVLPGESKGRACVCVCVCVCVWSGTFYANRLFAASHSFNCGLEANKCAQFAECRKYDGKCECPPGFGGDDCMKPGMSLQQKKTANLESGWLTDLEVGYSVWIPSGWKGSISKRG